MEKIKNTPVVEAATCHNCLKPLIDEELASPYKDDDGDTLCDDCHEELYLEHCSRCEEQVENKELESHPGEIIGVWREIDGHPDDLKPGYYRIVKWPFFVDGHVEGHMMSDNLKYISALDDAGMRAGESSWVPSGPICLTCREQIEADIKSA